MLLWLWPHAQDIANYLTHGTAAGGLGALGYMGNKARKMMKKHDKELGRNRGKLCCNESHVAAFKGTF